MCKLHEIVRLLAVSGLSKREIAGRVGVAASTVREAAGLTWPLPKDLSDADLEALLYKNAGKKQGHRRIPEPDWAVIHRELKRKHVTLTILWEECISTHPDGYRYSRFCELYRAFADRLPVTMRQSHAGGEKLFVDYAGDAVPVIVDRLTGAVRPAQIFVAVLGASSFSYAEATWTQTLPDWIAAHTRALAAIGGAPKLLVPDNAKVAIVKACRYNPQTLRWQIAEQGMILAYPVNADTHYMWGGSIRRNRARRRLAPQRRPRCQATI
jgi:transposase